MSTGRGGKGQARRPNRSQARAIEARARVQPVADASVVAPAVAEEVPQAPTRGSGRTRTGQRTRPVARPVALSRQQEYAFIRADLRRLLVTASLLLLVMLALLLVIEL